MNWSHLLQIACAAVSFEIRLTVDLIRIANGRIACAQAAHLSAGKHFWQGRFADFLAEVK